MMPTTGSGAVVLPMALDPVIEETLSDPLLSASLWTMVALMGLALVLFVYMGRNVTDDRVKLIFVATIGIPAVSIASYLGLVSGLTVGVVDIPGRGESVTLWGRYLTWTFSTPLILFALGSLAGTSRAKMFAIVVFDIAMCLTGLAAALTTRALWLRWSWFLLSSAFFAVVLYILLVEWPRDVADESPDIQNLFNRLKYLTVILWIGYPLVWAIGTEGVALLGTGSSGLALTSWGYSLLDIGAKFVFAFLLLRFLADEPAGVTERTRTEQTVAPGDD